MSERINVMVEDGTTEKLAILAGGNRLTGKWLSNLVRAMHNSRQVAGDDLYSLTLSHNGLIGLVRDLDARVSRLEIDRI